MPQEVKPEVETVVIMEAMMVLTKETAETETAEAETGWETETGWEMETSWEPRIRIRRTSTCDGRRGGRADLAKHPSGRACD